MRIKSPKYLSPVNILEDGADEKIKEQGRLSIEVAEKKYDLECLSHGIFASMVGEGVVELETDKHRIGYECWHKITVKESKEIL